MYGVLGEDDSDASTVKVLIRRLLQDLSFPIRTLGCDGSGGLLTKGARRLKALRAGGCTRFVVCYDADQTPASERYKQALERVVHPSGIDAASCCITIPVEEIEAWILADVESVTNVFPSWRPRSFEGNPEAVRDPKEALVGLSKKNNRKPIYTPAAHNERIAAHLDLHRVRQRCPSFEKLARFVTGFDVTPGQQKPP